MALIKCPKCGHNISDKALQCPKCGFNPHYHSGSQPQLSPSHIHMSREIKKNDDNNSVSRAWMYIAIGAGCVLLLVACIFILNNNTSKDLDNRYVDTLRDNSEMAPVSLDTNAPATIKDNTTKKKNKTSDPQPLTQYFIVNVEKGSVYFRDNENMAKVLKSLGFKTKVYNDVDFCEDGGPLLKASRDGTTVTLTFDGEDMYCKIHFNTEEELSKFIESMEVSQWERSGRYYSKGNNPACVYAKIEGNSVIMISPFEMLPNNF